MRKDGIASLPFYVNHQVLGCQVLSLSSGVLESLCPELLLKEPTSNSCSCRGILLGRICRMTIEVADNAKQRRSSNLLVWLLEKSAKCCHGPRSFPAATNGFPGKRGYSLWLLGIPLKMLFKQLDTSSRSNTSQPSLCFSHASFGRKDQSRKCNRMGNKVGCAKGIQMLVHTLRPWAPLGPQSESKFL